TGTRSTRGRHPSIIRSVGKKKKPSSVGVMASRKRSAVWSYFEDGGDPNKAVCFVCSDKIQHCGNTSNLLKHLRSKHQADRCRSLGRPRRYCCAGSSSSNSSTPGWWTRIRTRTRTQPDTQVERSGEEGEDLRAEQFRGEEAMSRADQGSVSEACYLSAIMSKKRSAVWTYYQDDEDGNKALCLICLENIQHRRNTSNLLKHLRKRHPAEYADVEDRTKRRQCKEGDSTCPTRAGIPVNALPRTAGRALPQSPKDTFSVCLSLTEKRALEQEIRVLERERELTEQLRRAQEQEARALEQQRALTEQLRRAQEEEMRRARELEARVLQHERQAIEQLRRAQEQESRALDREREALEQLRRECHFCIWVVFFFYFFKNMFTLKTPFHGQTALFVCCQTGNL
uniref:BED-type domain-containing protein n=1 Tax=Scleropages formosus TaxID=113540 RepID=A0A8C9T0V7_SCLFO